MPSWPRSTCSSPRPRPRPLATRARRQAGADKLAALAADGDPDGTRRPGDRAGDPDQARRADGLAGRRPRGQAPRPGPLSRRRRAVPRVRPRAGRRGWRQPGRGRRSAAGDAAHARRRQPDGRRRPGGPAPRDRPGDARRPGPEPDQHRPAGPDRRAPRRARPGVGGRGGPAPDLDGPADPGRDEVVHLRRPTDGPRRPRAGADPAPCRARARPPGGRAGRVRDARPGPPPADRPRERPVPDARRRARRLSRGRPRCGAA